MNDKIRALALLVLFLLLVAQVACSGPLPGLAGADAQLPEPVYTFTSLPPFPTASATPLPSRTATVTSSPRPTSTPIPTATRLVLPTSAPNSRMVSPVIARYLTTQPTIDGDWSEWKGVTDEYPANFVVSGGNQWTGADDLSSSFHLGWDETYLYLAIKVNDAQYVQKAFGSNLYNGDSLELLLDTQLVDDYDSAELSLDDFRLGISAGHPHMGDAQEAYLWVPYDLAGPKKTVLIEGRREGGMYRIEAAIPWAVFDMTPAAGEHYGFAISVSDNDDGDGNTQQSMISNLPARHPADPTTWGDLLLVK